MSDTSLRRGSDLDGLDTDRAIDRRQLLRAGAWAAPVIVLATAAPAAAASGPTTAPNPLAGFTANPGAGNMGPDMVSGASRTTTDTTWGSAGQPAANLTISGPFTPGGRVQLLYMVPSSSPQLVGSNPAAWIWGLEGNGDNFTSVWNPGASGGTGSWLISFNAPSWAAGNTLYLGLRLKLS